MKSEVRKVYHVVPDGDGWAVKGEGSQRASARFDNKEEAMQSARDMANNAGKSQLLIHGRDGKIQDERTYQDDPFPPAG